MNNIAEADICGVMFHHFSESEENDALGSITANKLDEIIHKVGRNRIVPAKEWYERVLAGSLLPGSVCLTFDDALRSQVDIALPVLEKYQLTAFWFVYSSVFEGSTPGFEIYRHFYSSYFSSFDEFFYQFVEQIKIEGLMTNLPEERERFSRSNYLTEFEFYSVNEREYRFLRDCVLGNDHFNLVMEKMLVKWGLDQKQLADGLWMSNDDLVTLARQNHVVGLHSYTHPTDLRSLTYVEQLSEYQRNATHISKVTGEIPRTVAHPVNSYSAGTLKILKAMGVELGFRSNRTQTRFGPLEYPRIDCVSPEFQYSK